MGPYCRYCDFRCFVLRVLNDGRTMLLATCVTGKAHDLDTAGETAETACNPVVQPRLAARLGLLREERSCTAHGRPSCEGSDCRRLMSRLRLTAAEPGEEPPDALEVLSRQYPRRTWAGHGRPPVAVFWGFRSADPLDFLSVRGLVGLECLIEGEMVPERENGIGIGSRVVVRFPAAGGRVLRFGTQRRFALAVPEK